MGAWAGHKVLFAQLSLLLRSDHLEAFTDSCYSSGAGLNAPGDHFSHGGLPAACAPLNASGSRCARWLKAAGGQGKCKRRRRSAWLDT